MAKMPFRGIARIVTAEPELPATPTAVLPLKTEQGHGQPSIRPLGYSAEDAQSAAPRAGIARWWNALKRMFLEPPR